MAKKLRYEPTDRQHRMVLIAVYCLNVAHPGPRLPRGVTLSRNELDDAGEEKV